ncbi:MAG: zinc-binding alcohol dehydrogenase [Phycisphaerae bacterium]|nr:zinc-binding alcohol dehydrogenase [Phycisphaerae bacterium]
MNGKALVCTEDQTFSMQDVSLGEMGPEDLFVRTRYSGVSIGTEFALIRKKLRWGGFPICTGYQAIGVIERVGAKVKEFQPGRTIYFRNTKSITLSDGTNVSPVAGTHCSHAVVAPSTTHGPALLPADVDPEAASLFVMPAVSLYGTDMAGVGMGDLVVVQGAGLIGLGTVAACALRGAEVIAIDVIPARLEAARMLGASYCIHAGKQDVLQAVRDIAPDGADVVFESTGVGSLIDQAILLARLGGKFVFQGNFGAGRIHLTFLEAHARQLRAFFPCDDGYIPARRAVMRLLASGALPLGKLITHRVPAEESPAFYDKINRNQADDVLGAVIVW